MLCQFLLLLCTISYPFLRLHGTSAQEWDVTPSTYCSGSAGSVPLYADASFGFGVTHAECKARCQKDADCKVFSHGQWQVGLTRRFGGHFGEMRCQLYARCQIKHQPKMSVFVRPVPENRKIDHRDILSILQILANVIALINGRFAILSAIISGCQLLLTAYGFSHASTSTGIATAALLTVNLLLLLALHRCRQILHEASADQDLVAAAVADVPPWRQGECQAPAWLRLATVSCITVELICSWSVAASLHKVDAVDKVKLARSLGIIVVWSCASLLTILLTDQRRVATPLVVAFGVFCLMLQGWIASTMNLHRGAIFLEIASHCTAIAALWSCRLTAHRRARCVLDVEMKRDAREQELVSLLVSRVQSRCSDMLDSSRWIAMVDICMSIVVLSMAALSIGKVVDEIIKDEAVLFHLVARGLGISLPKALRHSLVMAISVTLAPLLGHFFLRMHSGIQSLYGSSQYCRVKLMQQLAMETAEWVAAREREMLKKSLTADDQVCLHLEDEKGFDIASGGTMSNPSTSASPMEFSKLDFAAWVDSQAKRLLEYRLGDGWHIDHNFTSEDEARSAFLASDLKEAAGKVKDGASKTPSLRDSLIKKLGIGLCFFICLALICACVIPRVAGKDTAIPSAGSTINRSSKCSEAALKWGGALTAASALMFAVPGVGPAGLAAIELAGAAGIGAGGGVTQLMSCYMGS